MTNFEKIPIFDFWIHVWKNFEMKFRIYGTQIKEIQPQIKKIKVAWELNSNWTRIELDLNPINENFILKILEFRHFKKLKLRLLILNDWIISTIKWIWLLLIRSTVFAFMSLFRWEVTAGYFYFKNTTTLVDFICSLSFAIRLCPEWPVSAPWLALVINFYERIRKVIYRQ